MTVSILGARESGVGAALLAKKKGLDVFVSDADRIPDQYKWLLTTHHIPFEEKGHTLEKIRHTHEVIKSPGIPNEATILMQLRNYHIPIIDEIEFASRYTKSIIIAVTGSNGKSTTAHLIYHLLKSANFHVALAGNVGYSFAKCITENNYDYYVLELSSFQLENLYRFKPHIACILNITPDHLNRYSHSIEKYIQAKLNILQNMTASDHFIYTKDDITTAQYVNKQIIIPQLYPITRADQTAAPIYNRNKTFYFNLHQSTFTIREEQMPLPGMHNQYNTVTAITAAVLAGASPQSIHTALPQFHGIPHRIEWCGAPLGINCYNDSKSTNIASAAAALHSFPYPIIWIVGGQDKGNDYTPLMSIVQKWVKAIICLGKDNQRIIQAFHHLNLLIKETNTMESAIASALQVAANRDVILLSPACASFDLFKNFEDRGNQFREGIQALCNQMTE